MTDKLTHIDEKIYLLKKKKERIQVQQALAYMKESQKLLKEEFSPLLALTILTETWTAAPETKKETWKKRSQTFPSDSFQLYGKKAQPAQPAQPAAHQS
jgi:hypothetical protein